MMQHEEKEESEEASSPDVHESTLHGDVVSSMTGCLLHYLLLWE